MTEGINVSPIQPENTTLKDTKPTGYITPVTLELLDKAIASLPKDTPYRGIKVSFDLVRLLRDRIECVPTGQVNLYYKGIPIYPDVNIAEGSFEIDHD